MTAKTVSKAKSNYRRTIGFFLTGLLLATAPTLGFSQELSQESILKSVTATSEKFEVLLTKVIRVNRAIDEERRADEHENDLPDSVLETVGELKDLQKNLTELTRQLSRTIQLVRTQVLTENEKKDLMELVRAMETKLSDGISGAQAFVDKLNSDLGTDLAKLSI